MMRNGLSDIIGPEEIFKYAAENDLGLDKVAARFPEIKQHSRLFLELMKDGAKYFDIIGDGKEGIILDIINEGRSNYIAKFPKILNRTFADEYKQHLLAWALLYEGRNDPKYGVDLQHVEVPYLSTKYSTKGSCLVIDRLEGYTLKNLFLRHFFAPLFDDKATLEDLLWLDKQGNIINKDNVIINDLQTIIKPELEKQRTAKEDILAPKYVNLSVDEVIAKIESRKDDSKDDIAFLNLVMGKSMGQYIGRILTSYRAFYKQKGVEREDGHAGNYMICPGKKDKLPTLGPIDFGKLSVNDNDIYNKYGIV